MTTVEPEKQLKAINDASVTLESKAVVDRKFPDLYKTFTVDPKSPCGFLPHINRAYFVIKNRLCLLDYINRDIAHLEEEHDIVGVGVVAPKPGVFVSSVKQLLVIATTTVIKILGIADGPDGLKFVNSTMATLAGGVYMHQIVGTSQGRIFMLGSDDNVWELNYKEKESWFSGKCSKKLQTSGSSLLHILFGKPSDRIVQLAVNESGTILYQLTQQSSIYVVYLGTDGFTYKTACKKHDCIADAKISQPSSNYFTPETRIVSIHTTTKTESLFYHLVAITSNGSRIYYSNQKSAQQMNYDAEPTALITMHVRAPANSVEPKDTVGHSLYRNGLTLFVKNPDASPTQSQIVAYSPSLANLGNLILANAFAQLIEDSMTLDVHGKVLSVVEAPNGYDDINEFKYAYHTPARHFLVLTTSGVTVLAKQRPVDMLHNLLQKTGLDTRHRLREIEPFFNQFGYLNGCSLCLNLICSANVVPATDSVYSNSIVTKIVSDAALVALRKFGQVTSPLADVNRRSYSSLHDGLALFIYRSVQDIWDRHLAKETATSTDVVCLDNIATQQLKSVLNIMTSVKKAIDQHPELFSFTFESPETTSYQNLLILIDHISDVILKKLSIDYAAYINSKVLSEQASAK
ncbi:hypothetical protein MUCCIDRAFT_76814 [Mucor lusitanicus CBS 277.49]|uniref:Nucleoporin Nup133/Nup155-like N-terminal domain-containing protein n=1 Tax=Mucor lusitanicus CBS 277.49 TaxID=747725 RepID=A0A168PV11_MUCCL|nr:hypothetical protein MUCCIDRAFT_76814 [Mucor lusitanicus CBS 277.49]